jgi:TetR/AcrR family transcriptional regulator, cholesterol catabolism regulator
MARTSNNSKELSEKKQRQICKGAMSVFRIKGFHATSTREIAKASHMSLGSLYYYIEKKEDILFLIHKEVLNQIYDCLRDCMERYEDPATQLVQTLRELFGLTCRLKDEMLFIYTETKSLEKKYLHEILEKETEFVRAIESLIRRGVEEGKFVCRHPDIFANIIAFTGTIVPLRGWNILPHHSEEEVLGELTNLILRGLNSQISQEQSVEKKMDL